MTPVWSQLANLGAALDFIFALKALFFSKPIPKFGTGEKKRLCRPLFFFSLLADNACAK